MSNTPKLPTDLEILECIYNHYYNVFISFTPTKRVSKMYVPVDFDLIGRKLGVDGDIPFGVLYYYLNAKHRFTSEEDGKDVELFIKGIGPEDRRDVNCVQFAFLAAVLAELKNDHRKYVTQIRIGWISLAISVTAILVSLFGK